MMLRALLVLSLSAAALALVDTEDCCSAEDRREIQWIWNKVWASSFTDRKVTIARAIFADLFNHYPDAKAIFSRVNVEHPDSPEYRSHLVRVANGLDTIINMFDEPAVLYHHVQHLGDQHVARPGVKAAYMRGIVESMDRVLPQVAPCFNVEAWGRCFYKIANTMASKLP